MIETVKGIKINGRCFDRETSLSFFPGEKDRIAIVYGKNGSGKSTISDGFSLVASDAVPDDLSATLIDFSDNKVELSEQGRVFVFNEKYIEENVKIDGDSLGTIILLGSQVDLQAEISRNETLLVSAKQELDTAKQELDEFNDPKNTKSPEHFWENIKKELQGEWAKLDCDIRNNKINSKVTDDIMNKICHLEVSETEEVLRQQFSEANELLKKVANAITKPQVSSICEVQFEAGMECKLCSLLAKTVEQPVLTEREAMILSMIQNGRQYIVENAKKDFSESSTAICPYCFQKIDDEYRRNLIASIKKVLNKDVDKHRAELQAISFPVLDHDYGELKCVDEKLSTQVYEQLSDCKKMIDQYGRLIKQKLDNIYSPVETDPLGLENNLHQLNKLLRSLDKKRQKIVEAMQQQNELREKLIVTNNKIARKQINTFLMDYQKQKSEKEAAEANWQSKQQTVGKIFALLERLKQQRSNAGLAIDKINNALDYVFFSHGRLSLELKDDRYYLKSNGKNVRPKNVSLGERNIIALCYFFTQMLADQDVEKLYKKEQLVVIDDPISSVDFENMVGVSSFLKWKICEILAGNDKSKIILFTHDLSVFSALKQVVEGIEKAYKKQKQGVPVQGKSFELQGYTLTKSTKAINEYRALLQMIFMYAKGETGGLELAIGNSVRRALEAFSTFTYGLGIAEVCFDSKVIKTLGKYSGHFGNLMHRIVLNGESHLKERVYTMQDDLNFSQFISEEEKQRTCKEVLCFIYCLSPHHVEAHLQEAISNIQEWMKEVQTNDVLVHG